MPLSNLDLIWIVLCAALVFLMQLGFAMVESGTVRSKNTINVAMKNLIDTIVGIIFFWMVGYGLMFGSDLGGLIGVSDFFIDGTDTTQNALFFFQAMFAATAVTIVSGGVAERMKFNGYVLTSIVVTALIYPVFGHWAWGEGGWLKEAGFIDFAGSTVVHSVGGWIGLAGAIMLGPRLGKFRRGKIHYFAPNNHNFLVFGVFILWFAWFGFNAGSLLRFDASATTILLNTTLSAAFGGFGGYLISFFFRARVGVEIFSFGILSGLVGITAGCANVSANEAAIIGFVSVFLMFAFDQILLRRLHVDDPLSVVGIHGIAGAWGTLAVGLFADLQAGESRMALINVQLTGIATAFVFAFGTGMLFFLLLKAFRGLRVSKRHEVMGLNVSEHNARLPWVETIESIIKIMKTGNTSARIYEERDTEVGVVARFFNYLLEMLHQKQIALYRANSELQTQAVTDTLTGIFNRRGVLERFGGRNPYTSGYSIIMFDIDHFKNINDTYGHDVGDRVLKALASLIAQQVRHDDLVGRWGGEEFIVMVRGVDLASVEELAEKLRERVATHSFEGIGRLSCSFGLSSPKDAKCDFNRLFKQADEALYQAKKLGRNRVCSW